MSHGRALASLCNDDPLGGRAQFTDETLDAWVDEVVATVRALTASLPADVADRELSALTRRLVPLRAPARTSNLDDVGVQAAMLLHMARELGRTLRRRELEDPAKARDLLLAGLGSLPDDDLARILGVTRRTLTSWRDGRVPTRNALRITTLATVVSALLGSYTSLGVKLWLQAPRPELDGKTTLDGLDDDPQDAWMRLAPTLRNLRG